MKRILLVLVCTCFFHYADAQEKNIGEKLAQEQLDAYNKRDIEGFLKPYADTVAIYNFPDQLIYKGKDAMRKDYAEMFTNLPDLHCTLKNRIVLGNKVIDEESVIFNKNNPPVRAAAIYTISGGKIVAVHFISQ
ncbi:MAG: nuclear transport factor 2 family protein [Chitinophagaceae bacterium]|nr:nuclear transport factor 2 family protein [Chitinophagaceae bacterium]